MCGRTACTLEPGVLCKACSYKVGNSSIYQPAEWKESPDGKEFQKTTNFSPTMYGPVMISKKIVDPSASPEERIIQPMMWGMVPPWHVGTPTKHGLTTNNCRLEGIEDKKLYREPLKKGYRCVVLCDGFYEWKTESKKNKQPYFIHFPQPEGISFAQSETWEKQMDQLWSQENGWKGPRPLTMAGLFDKWKSEDGLIIYSYSVVTMDSSSAVSFIHERMPAILETDEDVRYWLDSFNVSSREALSRLKPSVNLISYPVSTQINSVRNQDMNLNQPIDLNKPKPLCGSGKLMANWLTKASPLKKDPVDPEKDSTTIQPSVKRQLLTDPSPGSPVQKRIKTESVSDM